MITRFPAFVLAGLLMVAPAWAHRLDEYAQAATIALTPDTLTLDMRLTPGHLLAAEVLAVIDTDADGTISPNEQTAYIDVLKQDISLTIDGEARELHLSSSSFPKEEDIRGGVGVIALSFEAGIPIGSDHTLVLENRHMSDLAIYLVNVLQPQDDAIAVLSQGRSRLQDTFELSWTVGAQ